MNLCRLGGLECLLNLISGGNGAAAADLAVRRLSCQLLTSVMSNNREVQEYAVKSGALNLIALFKKEPKIELKDAMFGCFSALIKADNFEGKRKFI